MENYESQWNVFGTSVSGVNPEYLNTSSFLFVEQNTTGLTIGKLVSRLLTKSYTEKETFWVDLADKDIYCYDPCPALGDCCSIEEPKETRITENSEPTPNSIEKYSWFTWVDKEQVNNEFTLIQNYTKSESLESLKCGALEITGNTQLDFFRENCRAKHKPLCMKGESIQITPTRKRKTQKKKKTKNSKRKNAMTGKGSSGRQGRQLTDTGRPIEMCATVLPALVGNNNKIINNNISIYCFVIYAGVCYFWPSLCSDSETATTEQTTEVPDYYDGGDYEEYDYDNYARISIDNYIY